MFDKLTVHTAIRFFDFILCKLFMLEKDLVTIRKSRALEYSNSLLAYAIFKKSDALFMTSGSKERLERFDSFQLIAITCLLIASKFTETDQTCLRIYELEKEYRYQYTFKNITSCEQKILEEINWNTFVQTPYHYVNLFLSAGVLFSDDEYYQDGEYKQISHHNDMGSDFLDQRDFNALHGKLKKLIETDYDIHNYEMLKYDDRIIALSMICCARKDLKIKPMISPHYAKLYDINVDDINECMDEMMQNIIKIPLLKRRNSVKGLGETTRRYNEVEVVIQGSSTQ